MMLAVKNLNTFYELSHVIQDLSLSVDQGEIAALLGRNGMGKSTTLKSIMGLARPSSGQILYQGIDLTGKPPHRVAQAGIGYIPEDRRIFANLTVRENLQMGAKNQGNTGSGNRQNKWTIDRIFDIFPWMKERSAQNGRFLSGGEQQMLAIGRALMGNPDLLLVDEPTEGLAPLIVRQVRDVLRDINQAGMTLLLVEHNYSVAASLADRVYLMGKARIGYEGTMAELEANPKIKADYLEV
ncbi:MAG: ABC transporter ATP-binding protein [Desulfobacterales bacterium]|nr:ABC transporter ATP-binding protein [Desulfobacterales bacterium]MBS3756148.1 ABC transporter ATP-binding protein [Desulfobacterales bacterium]